MKFQGAFALRCLVLAFILAAACGTPSTPISLSIVPASDAGSAHVKVSGLSSSELSALRASPPPADVWLALLSVRVAGVDAAQPAVTGAYMVGSEDVTFTPRFPFDPGRSYDVAFDPSKLPVPRRDAVVRASLALPNVERVPSVVVTRVLPTSEVVPENLLRMYIEFSKPMGRASGLPFVHLLDNRGQDVREPFLPLDVEFWNPEHTRFTLFFDPGRVKRGILPNEQMGRALVVGRRYTVVVDAAWRDAQGAPLKSEYRQQFRVGPADNHPIALQNWRITAPRAGGRDPLIVSFPDPLDHGLLSRALGVGRAAGGVVTGTARIDPGETRWNFIPDAVWSAGAYEVVVLGVLEDVAGNQIDKPFEVDMFKRIDTTSKPSERRLKFDVR
ncbi:MAG TPA: hypothetical protein VFV98_06820 [Vicinamibacterales bacterium]|nr:hypothetical protein [Vicinamibacterales bacterium]